jgi:hypothetical protein
MRITLRLDEKLVQKATQAAKERGETIEKLFERALRSLLTAAPKQSPRAHKRLKLPVSKAGGGTLPGVNLDDSAALLDRMEGIGRR